MNTKGRTSQEDTTLDLSGPLGTPRRVLLPRQRASILSEERNKWVSTRCRHWYSFLTANGATRPEGRGEVLTWMIMVARMEGEKKG